MSSFTCSCQYIRISALALLFGIVFSKTEREISKKRKKQVLKIFKMEIENEEVNHKSVDFKEKC